jgi:hypothetical protein
MTSNFFAKLTTVEEIKKAFRDLARQYHPDLGGDEETMKLVNAQYHAALNGQNGVTADGRTYKYNQKAEQEIMDKINELLKIDGLEISLIGYWIWIHGETKPVKEALKAEGCRWHSGRVCWYWKPSWFGRTHSNPDSLDQLAAKYGCEKFTPKGKAKLSAA